MGFSDYDSVRIFGFSAFSVCFTPESGPGKRHADRF